MGVKVTEGEDIRDLEPLRLRFKPKSTCSTSLECLSNLLVKRTNATDLGCQVEPSRPNVPGLDSANMQSDESEVQ